MLFCKYQLIRTPAEPIRTRACHALHEAARNVKPTQNRLAHTRAQQQRCEEELTEETTNKYIMQVVNQKTRTCSPVSTVPPGNK